MAIAEAIPSSLTAPTSNKATHMSIYDVKGVTNFCHSASFQLSDRYDGWIGTKYFDIGNNPYIHWKNRLFFFTYKDKESEYSLMEFDMLSKSKNIRYTINESKIIDKKIVYDI